MKKTKLMLVLGMTLCMLSGQVVWAAEVAESPDAAKNVAELPESVNEAGTTDSEAVQEIAAGQGEETSTDQTAVPEEAEADTQADTRSITVDVDSFNLSTPIAHKREEFTISFKLQDDKYIFDGENSEIVLSLTEGVNFSFPIHYDSKNGTYTGSAPLSNWADIKGDSEVTVRDITLYGSNDDYYTIVNGKEGTADYNKNYQDLSGFELYYINKNYPFKDIASGAWYQGAVDTVNYLGLMTGTKPDTFAPLSTLSRAQFATIIYRMEGNPEVEYDTAFTDVPKGQFYTDAVIWASKAGIITGYNSKTFGTADVITREQMATMMYRYAKYCEFDVSGQADISSFPDNQNVSSYAKEAMSWANYQGIITGDGGKLNPQGNVNRAVCAAIVSRFIAAYSE